MKAIIASNELEKELKLLSPIIRKNPVIPITGAVLMEFTKNSVRIKGTDLETTAIIDMKCECPKAFDIVIGYEDIVKVCSRVNEPITFELKDDGIHIYGDSSKFKFPKIGEAEHFPNTTDDELGLSVDVDCDFFYGLSLANVCRSKEDLQVSKNMPCVDFKNKKGITIVGTDGNTMFLKNLETKPTKDLKVMVPDSFIQLTKSFQDATVWVSEKWIKTECGDRTIISRLGENKFVSYEVVLPTDAIYNLRVNRHDIKKHLQIVGVTANITTSACVFNFKEGELLITSQDIDLAKESETKFPVDHNVDFDSICLNGGIMLNLLNLIDSEEIEISFTAYNRVVYMKPVGDDTVLSLLMPIINLN